MSPSTAPSKSQAGRAADWGSLAALGLGFVAYALLSHWLMVHAANRPWAVAVLFGPLVLAVAATGWQRRQGGVLAACAAGVALIAAVVARGGVEDVNRMYVLQHGGIHLALAWAFGSTLRSGATPLITTIAEGLHRRLHQRFTPAMRAYTRWVTGAWTAFFIGMVVASALIYAFAPWPWWSFFCNVLTPLAAALMTLVEHVQRYRRHPDFERISIRAAFAAWRHAGTGTSEAPQ
jgi:uncharacterized membrane protein